MAKVRNQYIEMADAFRKLFELFLSYQMDEIKIKQLETIHFKNLNITSEFVKELTKETSHFTSLKKKDKAEKGHWSLLQPRNELHWSHRHTHC